LPVLVAYSRVEAFASGTKLFFHKIISIVTGEGLRKYYYFEPSLKPLTMKLKSLLFPLFALLLLFAISCINDHVIPPDNEEKSKLLLKSWSMLNSEDGADSLALGLDKSILLFSSDGSYKTTAFITGGGTIVTNRNWKWHPTKPNRILYWYPGQAVDENQNYIDIRELTESSLKITNSSSYGPGDYSFVPE
jgi:hypothetical protein